MPIYFYTPYLRVTPPAGPQIVLDFSSVDRMTVAQWVPEPLFTQKETVRRRLRNIKYGWRLRAFFAWVVEPASLAENELVAIGYHVNRNGHKLELSMDAGGTYREVVLSGDGWLRGNVEEKNIGGIYRAEFACVDPLSEASLPPELAQSPPALGDWHGQ